MIQPRLVELLHVSGLQVHKAIGFRQQRPYWKRHPSFEKVLMWLTPIHVLLACAHKVVSSSESPYLAGLFLTDPERVRSGKPKGLGSHAGQPGNPHRVQ